MSAPPNEGRETLAPTGAADGNVCPTNKRAGTMADVDTRIEQFKKMAADDPKNELGHFSLGRAYLEAGRHDEATASFNRVIELNANLSRAYHLLAQSLLKQGDRAAAVERLTAGVQVAHAR